MGAGSRLLETQSLPVHRSSWHAKTYVSFGAAQRRERSSRGSRTNAREPRRMLVMGSSAPVAWTWARQNRRAERKGAKEFASFTERGALTRCSLAHDSAARQDSLSQSPALNPGWLANSVQPTPAVGPSSAAGQHPARSGQPPGAPPQGAIATEPGTIRQQASRRAGPQPPDRMALARSASPIRTIALGAAWLT